MKVNFKPDPKPEPKPKKAKKPLKRSRVNSGYKRLYLDYFGFKVSSDSFCEIPHCGRIAVDVHHIECRGIGGTTAVEDINNLMGLCREHHLEYGDKKQWKEFLQIVHEKFIKKHKVN